MTLVNSPPTQILRPPSLKTQDNTDTAAAREDSILTALERANIVRLLDRGVLPSNLHYFVMEYVDGIPIDEYCDAHRLSMRDGIILVLSAMDAVEYAHQRLVIHADLKPAKKDALWREPHMCSSVGRLS